MIPHGNDFGSILVAHDVTHSVAKGDDGGKMIGSVNLLLEGDLRYGLPGHIKGPWGTGSEAILVNAIVWFVQTDPSLAGLRALSFGGTDTISGDTAIPVQWWLDAQYFAGPHGNSYYDDVILPLWQTRPMVTVTNQPPMTQPPQPAPVPATPAAPAASAPFDLAGFLAPYLQQLTALLTEFGQIKAEVAAIKSQTSAPAVKPNEKLPPKRKTKK